MSAQGWASLYVQNDPHVYWNEHLYLTGAHLWLDIFLLRFHQSCLCQMCRQSLSLISTLTADSRQSGVNQAILLTSNDISSKWLQKISILSLKFPPGDSCFHWTAAFDKQTKEFRNIWNVSNKTPHSTRTNQASLIGGHETYCTSIYGCASFPTAHNVDDIVLQRRWKQPIISQSACASASWCPDRTLFIADLFWSDATDGDEPV